MPDFPTRDPTQPQFWNERFDAGFTPWDARGVPPAFGRFLIARGASLGRRVLIPGCGSAYEAAVLDVAGFDVTAIDYSESAIAQARAVLEPALAARVLRHVDFFSFDAAPFDWIYERAFLAALPPSQWARWAARLGDVLQPNGLLAGFFFVDEATELPRRGPPFAAGGTELTGLLAGFRCEQDDAVPPTESLPVFARRERWMSWRRAAS